MRNNDMTPEERWKLADLERRIEETDDIDAMIEWAAFWAFSRKEWPLSDDVRDRVLDYYEAGVRANNPIACLNLGAIYNEGVLVKQDYEKSAELYRIAADSSCDPAIASMAVTNLGYYYYYDYAGTQNYQKAFNCFLHGALRYNNANAYYKLGDMYRYGYYVDKDEKMAFEMYMKAFHCEEDENYFKADIGLRLGECFFEGIGCEKDTYAALTLLQIAERSCFERLIHHNDGASNQLEKIQALMKSVRETITKELTEE